MDVALAVRLPDLGRVHVREPVVGRDLAGHVQDQPAQGIALVGVGVHTPVGAREVFVDRGFHVHQGLAVGAQAGVLLAVDDVGARRLEMVGRDQRLLDHVLHLLDVRRLAAKPVDQHLDDLRTQQRGFRVVELAARGPGAGQCRANLVCVERLALTTSLDHLARQADHHGVLHRALLIRGLNTTYGVHDTHDTL
ncbi:hypothetical protein D9M69_582650 [compost metagenome]